MSQGKSKDGSIQVILTALVSNLGIAGSKFVGAFITGSASMMAEAIHSVVDSTNQVLLLIGEKAERKKPDEKFPMGYGREAFFWSFIVALLLFSVGGLFAIYEGVHKLSDPHEMEKPIVAIFILGLSILLEGYSFYSCIKEVRRENKFGSLRKWVSKTTQAGLVVVFLEDLAALLGLVIALFSLLLSVLTGNVLFDAYGSIVVGVLLILVAGVLGKKMRTLLIGVTPPQNYKVSFKKILSEEIPSSSLLRLIALQTGGSEVMISMKITPGDELNTKIFIEKINNFEKSIKKHHPEIGWLFVEPDFEA